MLLRRRLLASALLAMTFACEGMLTAVRDWTPVVTARSNSMEPMLLAAGGAVSTPAGAQQALVDAPWMKVPGAPFTPYGQPSKNC